MRNTRLDWPRLPGCLVCLGPMTSYACRMPQRLGCMPQNSLCHKNRAQCFGIVHFSSTTVKRMELVGRGRGTTQSNNDDKRLSERLIQLRSHSTPSFFRLYPHAVIICALPRPPSLCFQCGLFFERFFKRKTRMNPWHYNCISNSVSSSVSIRISFISDSRSANASIAQILLLSTSTPRSPKVVEESLQAEVKAEALTVINSGDNKNKGTHILDAPTPTYISTLAHLQTHNNKNRS